MTSILPILESLPGRSSLVPDIVEVVSIALDVPASVREMREQTLSSEERGRASRFRFERDRRRFVACRGAVRALIASRTGAHPSSIEFRYGPRGKPELAGALAGALAFNVSHSGEIALCAIASKGPIGIDGERIRDLPDLESIATRFFSPDECAFLQEEPPELRASRFFYLWTLKEAWLKAEGDGLLGPLSEVEVARGTDGHPRLRARRGAVTSDLGWRLCSFHPVPGLIGALATRDEARVALRCWSD